MSPAPDTDRAGALAWLAGQLHFEQLLTELHAEAERTGAAVETLPQRDAAAPETARPSRAA